MKYQVVRSEKAADQLYDLLHYMTEDSGNIDNTLEYLNELQAAIMGLSECPYKGISPRYSALRKQGYYILIAGNQHIFYKINEPEQLVVIYAVVTGSNIYQNFIRK